MDLEKIKRHSGKIAFFCLNIAIAAGAVFYFVAQDRQEKEVILKEDEAADKEEEMKKLRELQAGYSAEKEIAPIPASGDPDASVTNRTESSSEVVAPVNISVPVTVPAPKPSVSVVAAPVKVNGECGSADSSAKRSNSKCDEKAPKNGLCSAGTASSVKFQPNKHDVGWNWTCEGQNGGTSATCRCS